MSNFYQQEQQVDTQFNINITTLSDLDGYDESTKRKLKALYEDQIKQSPEQAKFNLALGLFYLDLSFYPFAIKFLTKAHEKDPLNASILYYLALAQIEGKEPRILRYSTVQSIENYLGSAVALDKSQAHYFYLWALIKYEYYLVNGLTSTSPGIYDLLRQAKNAYQNRTEIKHMLNHVPVSDNPILEILCR